MSFSHKLLEIKMCLLVATLLLKLVAQERFLGGYDATVAVTVTYGRHGLLVEYRVKIHLNNT